MKRSVQSCLCALALALAFAAQGQGSFQNLDFESAVVVPIPGDPLWSVQFGSAFPGWISSVGGIPQTEALYNRYFLDSSGIALIDANWPHHFGPSIGLVAGGFTALLQAGVLGGIDNPADTSLSQSSLVPASAESLRFRAYSPFGFPLIVRLSGQPLPLVALSTGTNYTEFGADTRAWQGQVAELSFTLLAQRPHQVNNYLFLDSIEFSPEPIPEPGLLGLLGLGTLFLGWRRWSRRSS